MIPSRTRLRIAVGLIATLTLWPAGTALAQDRIRPGFNLFTVEQDQEMGRQSADEVERQLPVLNDRSIDAYIGAVSARLAAVTPGPRYPYRFKVINASDINAFALPGGYLYLNRGLIEATRSEGQLAGVMAHEMAHVALRHGTNQASKAYLGQAGLGLLGGVFGKDDRSTEKKIAAIGGFGLNTLFLKFSRTAEEQADVTGAQMLANAGYNPADMVTFFEFLADESARNPSKLEQYFSSHPPAADRAARIEREIAMLTVAPTNPVGGFTRARNELSRMRPAPTTQQLMQGQGQAFAHAVEDDATAAGSTAYGPSPDFPVFAQRGGLFRIAYPDTWRIYEANQGYGVIIAPAGGYVDAGGPERELISGVIVNHYDPFDEGVGDRFGGSSALDRATDDLVSQILNTNTNLKMIPNSERRASIDGSPSVSLILSGRSPVTRQQERVTVFARALTDDHILYALFIAPEQDYAALNATFNRMISSLQVGDTALHGAMTVPSGTVLAIELLQTLSSADSRSGDLFTARVVEPVLVDGRVAIATGSILSGRIVDVVASDVRKFGGRAQMNLEFLSMRIASGAESPISASFHGEGKSQKSKDAATIGGSAAGGAVLGRIVGKDTKSTVLGALIGGAIGTGIAARNKGEEVTLPEGMVLEIQLNSPFSG